MEKDILYAQLRRHMLRAFLTNNPSAFWYKDLKDEFLEKGGSPEIILEKEAFLSEMVPLLQSYLSHHLSNGGFRYSDHSYGSLLLTFLESGFSWEDFEWGINIGVEEFFRPLREEFNYRRK